MLPERLGPYEIRRKVGRGGMGTVYEAVHAETGEVAAVKLLSASLAHEPGFRQRFEAEIETLRKLHHPNIVQLFGFGEQDDQIFYAMELIDGSSLEEQLTRGRRFTWREVTSIAIETCRALRHAHDRGVIHRDIKPGNLLVDCEEHVKLSDFGIARLFGNTRITGAGTVLGTVEYMAPEQAAGRAADPRTDLYSLGGVMYALVAGRPPFEGKSLVEILEKQRTRRPEPLRDLAPETPAELEFIIHELLAKDPDRRIANATLLMRRLEAMQQGLSMTGAAAVLDGDTPADGAAPPEPPGEPQAQAPPAGPSSDVIPATRLAPVEEGELFDSSPSSGEALPETKPATVPPPPPAEPADRPKSSSRFVAVAPGDLEERPPEATTTAWVSPQTWALAACLIVIGLVAWYMLWPPTADTLYARVSAQTDESKAEEDIRQFLLLFPGDSRCEQLRQRQSEIELVQLERKLELRAKGIGRVEPLSPVEQTYLEALSYSRLDPDLGLVRLQALIDLYDHRKDLTNPTGRCLELARRRVAQLRGQIDQLGPDHLTCLRDRLDHADGLRTTDPARAEAIYRAVIELYQNKPWAAEAVRRAREAMRGA